MKHIAKVNVVCKQKWSIYIQAKVILIGEERKSVRQKQKSHVENESEAKKMTNAFAIIANTLNKCVRFDPEFFTDVQQQAENFDLAVCLVHYHRRIGSFNIWSEHAANDWANIKAAILQIAHW